MPLPEQAKLIIFFDGTCGLCHRFVYFALCKMKGETLLFAPQESSLFRNIPHQPVCPSGSIIVYLKEKERLFSQGDAFRLIFFYLQYPWKIVSYVLYLIPRFMLNIGYEIIAKYRYKFFKKPDHACPFVTPERRKFFLE